MKLKKFKFKKVKSTNNTAIRIIKNSNYKSGMVTSDKQIRGKGQYGKKWISYKGNLFASFFYNLNNFDISMSELTKVNCMIVKKLLSKYYKKKIDFKKPNDLMVKGKKICGILQETINKFDSNFLVVGIGINLIKNPIIKNYPTVNLYDLVKKKVKKKIIENELKKIFEKNLIKFTRKKVL